MIPRVRWHHRRTARKPFPARASSRRVAVIVLFACLQVAAEEHSMGQASEAMRAGNYAEAFCIWRPQAEAGNAEAQYNLGWMYHNGYGLVIDDVRARRWWTRAAEQGHSDAQFALGMLYYQGDGAIGRDIDRAAHYFVQSARAGNDDAGAMLRTLIDRHESALAELVHELLQRDWQLLGGALEVNVDRANVRARAGKDAQVLMVLSRGRPLVELNRRGEWVRVGVAGSPALGWVHGSLVRPRSDWSGQ